MADRLDDDDLYDLLFSDLGPDTPLAGPGGTIFQEEDGMPTFRLWPIWEITHNGVRYGFLVWRPGSYTVTDITGRSLRYPHGGPKNPPRGGTPNPRIRKWAERTLVPADLLE